MAQTWERVAAGKPNRVQAGAAATDTPGAHTARRACRAQTDPAPPRATNGPSVPRRRPPLDTRRTPHRAPTRAPPGAQLCLVALVAPPTSAEQPLPAREPASPPLPAPPPMSTRPLVAQRPDCARPSSARAPLATPPSPTPHPPPIRPAHCARHPLLASSPDAHTHTPHQRPSRKSAPKAFSSSPHGCPDAPPEQPLPTKTRTARRPPVAPLTPARHPPRSCTTPAWLPVHRPTRPGALPRARSKSPHRRSPTQCPIRPPREGAAPTYLRRSLDERPEPPPERPRAEGRGAGPAGPPHVAKSST